MWDTKSLVWRPGIDQLPGMLLETADPHTATPFSDAPGSSHLSVLAAREPDTGAVRRLGPSTSEFVLPNGHRITLVAGNGAGHYPAGYLERLRTTGEC
jgi:hypothetical protein